MTLTEINQALSGKRKGAFVSVCYITNAKNGYSKETQTIVRFVNYANIKGVQAKGKGNPNETYQANGFVFFNSNTNKYYLRMATTNTKTRAKVKYFLNGVEIDKATYELANPPKPSKTPLVVFTKNIADIVSLG